MSLSQRSVRSTFYTFLGSGITTIVQLIRSILLARLIAPEIFGIYSFVSSFVIITSTLPNFGMASALLNRTSESEGEEPLAVHFTISLVFNILWFALVALIGKLILPMTYHLILWVILATQFLDNLVITSRTLLVRRVIFRRIALVDTTSIILSSISAVILAWKGFGIQGLISTDIITALVVIFGFLIIKPPWKPRLSFSQPVAKYLLNFGYRTFLGNIVGQALDYVDNLWTGQFLGKAALGYYSRAFTFSSYPRKILAYPLNAVTSGTYAELKGNSKQLSEAFFWVNSFLIRSSFFMAGFLALIAPEFIHLVIGNQWLPMLNAFRLMLLYTMLDPIRGTISNLFIAIGKPEKVFWSRLIQLIVLIGGLFIFGYLLNIAGVAIAVNLMIFSGIVIMLWQARPYVKFSILKMFGIPLISLTIGIGLARLSIEIPGILGSYWRTAIIKSLVFSVVYLGLVLTMERKNLQIYADMLSRLIPKKSFVPIDESLNETKVSKYQ